RHERSERGMHTEETVEINGGPLARSRPGNGDARASSVVLVFAVGHYDIESINRATLKDGDEDLLPFRCRRIGHLHEDIRKQAAGDECQSGRFQKESAIDHGYLSCQLSVVSCLSCRPRQPTTENREPTTVESPSLKF